VDANRQVIKAMAMIQRPRDGAWLVSQHTDPAETPFQRPLGGHVEFGEYALDTVRREFREEIGQELAGVRLLGVLENIFTVDDGPHHEIVFVYRADFADPAAYEIAGQDIRDEVGRTRVIWRPAGATVPPLYPPGAAELAAG
jgi:ADP-ribose pyrophosphatase YjhB (NUDIX family)